MSGSSTNVQYPSAKAVWDLVQTIKRDTFQQVNTTTYPTLEDFLETTGEEGIIYLYPVDTSDLTKGYKQYIWENNSWIFIGDTTLDLSDYVPTSRTIAGLDLVDNITSQELTNALTFMNSTTDVDDVMED